MQFNSCILLYSKYSARSKQLMDYINKSGVDLTNVIKLQSLCVDNKEVRTRITKNTQIGISSVPCILLIYQDGGIEKYEGISVFNWCEEVIKQFIKPPQQHYQIPADKIDASTTYKKEQQKSVRNEFELKDSTDIENNLLFEENKRKYEEQQNKEERLPTNTNQEFKRYPIDKSKSKISKQVTNIDDLPSDYDDDDEDNDEKSIGRVRTHDENYEDSDLLQGSLPNTRKTIERNDINKINNSIQQKTSDIMNKAKELAKGRENDNPLPPGHPANKKNR